MAKLEQTLKDLKNLAQELASETKETLLDGLDATRDTIDNIRNSEQRSEAMQGFQDGAQELANGTKRVILDTAEQLKMPKTS